MKNDNYNVNRLIMLAVLRKTEWNRERERERERRERRERESYDFLIRSVSAAYVFNISFESTLCTIKNYGSNRLVCII